ncbi:MAG: hypothetical protein ABFQ89_04915, partial [Chloroflexota bacterium]
MIFFERVIQFDISWRGRVIPVPCFYFDCSSIAAIFLTPLKNITRLLPSKRMKPVRVTPWHGVTIVGGYDYRDSDLGSYCDGFIGFSV